MGKGIEVHTFDLALNIARAAAAPTPWKALFAKAMILLDDMAARSGVDVHWTFGGGTVLMLRHYHRLSKDIDIFVPDPQALGYLNPRLGGIAESLTGRYEESASHLKLLFLDGEIDFVASPNLTSPAFDNHVVEGRGVRLETSAEIIAKKMWHRGQHAKARDLFDLAMVIEREPVALAAAGPFLTKYRGEFLAQLDTRRDILKLQFEQIDVLDFQATFDECVAIAQSFLRSLPVSNEN